MGKWKGRNKGDGVRTTQNTAATVRFSMGTGGSIFFGVMGWWCAGGQRGRGRDTGTGGRGGGGGDDDFFSPSPFIPTCQRHWPPLLLNRVVVITGVRQIAAGGGGRQGDAGRRRRDAEGVVGSTATLVLSQQAGQDSRAGQAPAPATRPCLALQLRRGCGRGRQADVPPRQRAQGRRQGDGREGGQGARGGRAGRQPGRPGGCVPDKRRRHPLALAQEHALDRGPEPADQPLERLGRGGDGRAQGDVRRLGGGVAALTCRHHLAARAGEGHGRDVEVGAAAGHPQHGRGQHDEAG